MIMNLFVFYHVYRLLRCEHQKLCLSALIIYIFSSIDKNTNFAHLIEIRRICQLLNPKSKTSMNHPIVYQYFQ